METRIKAIKIAQLVLFTLSKIPNLDDCFNSLIRCAAEDIKTAIFHARAIKNEKQG